MNKEDCLSKHKVIEYLLIQRQGSLNNIENAKDGTSTDNVLTQIIELVEKIFNGEIDEINSGRLDAEESKDADNEEATIYLTPEERKPYQRALNAQRSNALDKLEIKDD